jgi:hypothetical protein
VVCNKSNTTGAACGAGTAYPQVFSAVSVAQLLVFSVCSMVSQIYSLYIPNYQNMTEQSYFCRGIILCKCKTEIDFKDILHAKLEESVKQI